MTSEEEAKAFAMSYVAAPLVNRATKALVEKFNQSNGEQRLRCADNVKREGYRKNYVPTIRDYVAACLNATGDE